MGEALHVDRLREEIIEGKHVGEDGARAVELSGDLLERRAAGLVIALTGTLVAETPDDCELGVETMAKMTFPPKALRCRSITCKDFHASQRV